MVYGDCCTVVPSQTVSMENPWFSLDESTDCPRAVFSHTNWITLQCYVNKQTYTDFFLQQDMSDIINRKTAVSKKPLMPSSLIDNNIDNNNNNVVKHSSAPVNSQVVVDKEPCHLHSSVHP